MKRRLMIIISVVVLLGAAVYAVFALNRMGIISFERMFTPTYPLSVSRGAYGTAGRLEGRTVCVSIYADTDETVWDDQKQQDDMYTKLGDAVEWIEETTSGYGVETEFLYDWKEDPELYHHVSGVVSDFNYRLDNNDGYNKLWNYINNEIPTEELIAKYDADNVIYLVFILTGDFDGVLPYACDGYFEPDFYYDTAFIPTRYTGHEVTASVIAHEILHLYGAADLYNATSDESFNYKNNQQMVDYITANYPDELMLRTFDYANHAPFYGKVNGMMSPITAYYVGLTDEIPQAVLDFGLDLSTFDPNRTEDSE